jgi:predicted metal-dependent hydrolase
MSRSLSPESTEFKRQVLDWAKRFDLQVNSLTVRPMERKWASCSTAGNLTFNSELLELDDELQRYVIVHELLHLSIPNHGPLWKSLMRAHLGPWEALEGRLSRISTAKRGEGLRETGS